MRHAIAKLASQLKMILKDHQNSRARSVLQVFLSLARIAVGRTTTVSPMGGGSLIAVDLATANGKQMYRYGMPFDALAFGSLVSEGDFVVDAGANVGMYALLAASRAGAKGLVVAIEPGEGTLRMLERNLALNGQTPVEIVPAAVADRPSEAKFVEFEPGSGLAHLAAAGEVGDQALVAVTTIDEVVKRYERALDVLKIDVEGAELLALKGARLTLRDHSPRLFIEIEPSLLERSGTDPREIDALLVECGYKTFFGVSATRRDHLMPLGSPSQASSVGSTNVLCLA